MSVIQCEGKRSFVLLVGAAWLIAPVDSRSASATDLDTVTSRVIAQLIATDPSDSTVEGYMSSLQSNGSWSYIDYSNTSETNWTPATALTQMLDMAESYSNSSSSLHQNTTLEADILNAYNYWMSVNPQSTNWYDNDIRTPQGIGSTMVLMESDMSATQLSEGNTILNQARSELSVPSIATGSNLVLLATVGINQGIVDGNTADVSQGFGEIQSTIQVVSPGPGEGIEPDNTYQFHGPQLYIGDYGTTALTDPLQYASIAAGTSFAIDSAQEQILVNALLDGSQWFVYGQSLDFSASGRDASRQGFDTDGADFVSAIEYALSLGSYRSSELEAFLNRQEAAISSGSASSSLGLTGNKDFFDSDIMVQQRPNYFESAKVTSIRTVNPESINGENLEGLYMADGVNEIMVTGNEYNNIEPVWNWRRLPGTTVEQNTRSLQPGSADAGSTSYAGGVSDGTYGAEALDYNRFNVAAQKSWFFFDNEEVALGAAINAPNATSEVDTTLNQCLLTGTVTYETTGSSTPQTLTSGTVTPAGLQWVYQGGVGYYFPTPVSNATISAVTQSGNWQEINSQYSNSTVTQNVFSLYIDHGSHTSNGSYFYIVVPDTTAAGMSAYVADDPIQVLSNNAEVQAVQQTSLDITQAAFYTPDSFSIVPGQTVAANAPSAVMLERQPDVLKLDASSPQNLQMTLQVQLSGVTLSGSSPGWFDAMGTSTVSLNLPGGNLAGSTVGLTLQSNGNTTPIVSLSNTTGSAPLTYTVTAPVTLSNNTTFETDANSTLVFSAPIGGGASLASAGTLVFSGGNTYTSGTSVDSGTLTVNAGGTLGAATGGLVLGTPVPATNGTTTPIGNLFLNTSVTVGSFSSTTNNATANLLTINPGFVMTDTGAFVVGGINNNTSAIIYDGALTVTGGGSLIVSGSGNFGIGQTSNNKGGKDTTTVDLSGLNSVSINTTGTVGIGNGINSSGALTLADTIVASIAPSNFINASEIDVGNSEFNNDAGPSTLNLGSGANTLQAGVINIGFGKTGGAIAWVGDAGPTSQVMIDGTGGGSAVANITLGQANAATYTAGRLSQLLLAGHDAIVQAGMLTIGDSTGNALNGPNSTVTFDTGKFAVQSVILAADTGGTSTTGPIGSLIIGGASPNSAATGVFTVGSVSTPGTFDLGYFTNNIVATASPTFTINSGVVNMYANIVVVNTTSSGTTTSNLTLAGNGVLNMESNSIGNGGMQVSTVQLAPNSTDTATLENLGGGGINGSGLTMNGSGTLTLLGTNSYTGGTIVNSGKLIVGVSGALPTGALAINNSGIARLADNITAGTPLGTSSMNLTSLSITGTGTLDIGNNRVIIDYTTGNDPIASIAAWINNGFYDLSGPQIISSDIAADDAASGLSYGIGYADGADGLVAGLPSGEIEIMFTLLGDANLDGQVNAEDFTPFSANVGKNGSWDDGDFNYDGIVNSEDFTPFSANLGKSATLAAAAGILEAADGMSLTNVPEPGCVGLLVLAGLGVLHRRRRRS
jgi:autotransporter-associated beta strand protein